MSQKVVLACFPGQYDCAGIGIVEYCYVVSTLFPFVIRSRAFDFDDEAEFEPGKHIYKALDRWRLFLDRQ